MNTHGDGCNQIGVARPSNFTGLNLTLTNTNADIASRHDAIGPHVVLLEEVLAQARGHEHPAGLRVRTEVSLAALAPRGRHVRVELHCAHIEGQAREGTAERTSRREQQ